MATIEIADNDARVQYTQAVTANTTQLTIDFPFFNLDDINVIVTDSAGNDTTLTRGTGTGTFSVTGTAVDDGFSGGHITLGDTYVSTTTYTIFRDIDIERTTDFPTSGPFNISSLNTELDKIFAIEQELETRLTRTVKLADSDASANLNLPNLNTRKGTVLAFNSTTGIPEAGPNIGQLNTIAAISADIGTLADIEDGTVATDAISDLAAIASNVTTVAGISSNVSTVAGISANVTSVAGNSSNINTVAGISANVTSVAGVSADVSTVAGITSDVTTVAGDSTDIQSLAAVSTEIGLLGTSAVIADMNLLATSAIITDMDALADLTTEIDALGDVTADVTTVAGIQANVTTVAGVASNVTTVANAISDVTTVAGISANTTTVAGISADVTSVAGISANVTTVAGDSANIATVAGISSDITTAANNDANITIVASNITGVNSFAERYRVGASDPTTSLDEGDLAYNSTANQLKYYDGSAWQGIAPGIASVSADASPSLGGDLDTNGNDVNFGDNDKAIFGAGSDLQIYHNGNDSVVRDAGTGDLLLAGTSNVKITTSGFGETMAKFTTNGAAELYYDNSQKLATTSTGVDVTGTVQADIVQLGTSKWTIELSTDDLIFKFNGVSKIKFASDGEIVTVDDFTSNGTI